MGVSTDAILVFGFDLGLEDETPEFLENYESDFDELLNDISGLPKYGEPGHDFNDQFKFRADFPIDLVLHCSYEYPMYILAIRGTEICSSRGEVSEIDLPKLIVSEDKIKELKDFCEKYDIEWQEPKWLLVSLWG